MLASDLSELVCRQLPVVLGTEGTEAREVSAHPVLNYGGFVNRSFRVTAGARAFHVKLTADAHSLRGLQRWRALADHLAERYRAPAMRAWMDVPGTPFAGPVFDWIEGDQPGTLACDVRREISAVLRRLHADDALCDELAALGDDVVACAQAYAGTYHDRFVEDMKLVRAAPPPFVDARLIDWIDGEIARLFEAVARSPAFDLPADAASHRDLWLDNLMVTDSGELFILDWDELGVGDPMMDWAMLLGPNRSRVQPAGEEDLTDLEGSSEERERFHTYARASLLDWIIDPLADWIEAANEPQHGAAVRDNNRRVHDQALALYRVAYAS